jgi:hypothetical protein
MNYKKIYDDLMFSRLLMKNDRIKEKRMVNILKDII